MNARQKAEWIPLVDRLQACLVVAQKTSKTAREYWRTYPTRPDARKLMDLSERLTGCIDKIVEANDRDDLATCRLQVEIVESLVAEWKEACRQLREQRFA